VALAAVRRFLGGSFGAFTFDQMCAEYEGLWLASQSGEGNAQAALLLLPAAAGSTGAAREDAFSAKVPTPRGAPGCGCACIAPLSP
jgi:hypothetical protein